MDIDNRPDGRPENRQPGGPLRVVLDEAAFRKLVTGKPTTVAARWRRIEMLQVEIILSDIGWNRMIDAIADAMATRMEGKSHDEIVSVLAGALGRSTQHDAPEPPEPCIIPPGKPLDL